MDEMGSERIAEDALRRLIEFIGEDPERKGLRETPDRILRSWKELFAGYSQDPEQILQANFHQDVGYDEMILLSGIEFVSFCEHHWLPIEGVAHVAYLPFKHIVGISKLARLVDVYAKRLQMQERMTRQIADALDRYVRPLGVGVVVEARHGCVGCRGVRKQNALMVTSRLTGPFREEASTRNEFFAAIRKV